jgi:hypothetical protein
MRLNKDNSAQLSIDFLLGVTIFILAFIFLFIAIPSLFVPFQSNSDELTMTADRVAANLVENVLANRSSNGDRLPGIVDVPKVEELKAALQATDNEITRKSLGLDNGNTVYHLQVVFEKYDYMTDTINPSPIPDDVVWGNQNVGQSRRFVYLRNLDTAAPGGYDDIKTVMVVRVW